MARQRKQMEQKAEEDELESLMMSSTDNDVVESSLSSKRFSIGRFVYFILFLCFFIQIFYFLVRNLKLKKKSLKRFINQL